MDIYWLPPILRKVGYSWFMLCLGLHIGTWIMPINFSLLMLFTSLLLASSYYAPHIFARRSFLWTLPAHTSSLVLFLSAYWLHTFLHCLLDPLNLRYTFLPLYFSILHWIASPIKMEFYLPLFHICSPSSVFATEERNFTATVGVIFLFWSNNGLNHKHNLIIDAEEKSETVKLL